MIKLRELLVEGKDIIVGIITTDDEIISHKDAVDHGDLLNRAPQQMYGVSIKNKWRYNKIHKTVYWWENWTKLDGELVADHLRNKYKYEVIHQHLIDVPDGKTYQDRYNKSHGLELQEAPMDTIQTVGDFTKGSSFTSKADRALVTHPVAVQKIKDFFKNTTENFDFYFVNTKHARKHTEVGEVKPEFIFDELMITPDQLKDGKINENNITVFFTNNKGAERAPLTPWIMGHRFGHVVRRMYAWKDELNPWVDRMLNNMLEDYGFPMPPKYAYTDNAYRTTREHQIATRHLCETIGTFKSARDKNLRDYFEFHYELFTQYLKDGDVKFNPLPDTLITGHGAFGSKKTRRLLNREEAEEYLIELQRDYHYYAENVLTECVGKIFVM